MTEYLNGAIEIHPEYPRSCKPVSHSLCLRPLKENGLTDGSVWTSHPGAVCVWESDSCGAFLTAQMRNLNKTVKFGFSNEFMDIVIKFKHDKNLLQDLICKRTLRLPITR